MIQQHDASARDHFGVKEIDVNKIAISLDGGVGGCAKSAPMMAFTCSFLAHQGALHSLPINESKTWLAVFDVSVPGAGIEVIVKADDPPFIR